MNTVNTETPPKWFPSETPEERVYWYSGYSLRDDLANLPGSEYVWEVYDTEEAAWLYRLQEKNDPAFIEVYDRPCPRTRAEVIAECKAGCECSVITVLDKQGNVVEEWTV